MAMSVGGDKSGVMCDINTTPLIDVMLVLLVTLIMSLPIQTHAVKLDIPPPPKEPPPPPVTLPIDIGVDFDDSVSYNGNIVDLNQLQSYFRSIKSSATTPDEIPDIHLHPDKRSHYDTTAKILAMAQHIGLSKIGFTNTVEFAE